MPQLRAELKTFNMHTTGRKAELVHRLETALAAARDTGQAADHLPSSSRPAVASSSAAIQQQKAAVTGRAAAGARPAGKRSAGQQAVPERRPGKGAGRQSQRKRKQPAGEAAAPPTSADAELRPGTAGLGEPVTFEVSDLFSGLLEPAGCSSDGNQQDLASPFLCSQDLELSLGRNMFNLPTVHACSARYLADIRPAAQEAAREKAQAGEGRNVEHLAEVDDALAEFIEKQKGSRKRQRS